MKCRSLAAALAVSLFGMASVNGSPQAPTVRSQPAATTAGGPPSLLVVLVVDQFRADYVDRYQHQWSSGLARLLRDGTSFAQAEYPYAGTVTCPGHASISTGRLPSSHGMILNTWWDRKTGKPRTCTADPTVRNLGHGGQAQGGDSLADLRGSTLADELRAQLARPSRTVALSLKARSATTLGGRRPDAVAWFDDSGVWSTSTAFATEANPLITAYAAQHPIPSAAGTAWSRARPDHTYLFPSPARGVTPKAGFGSTFPHALGTAGAAPDALFYRQWQSSPSSDAYLGGLALQLVRGMRLGQNGGTDLLAVSFSALDLIGHDYGPESHEVQDTLIRLDQTIGSLLAGLDELVGAGRYTVALTGDHGVAPIPEDAAAEGLPAGRLVPTQVRSIIDTTLGAAFSPGTYVAGYTHPEVYLTPGTADRLRARPEVLARLKAALLAQAGVARVFTAEELQAAPAGPEDRLRLYASRSHDPHRSGDLTLLLEPYWLQDPTGTTHGTAYGYDTRVPLVLFGRGVRTAARLEAASPLDIAPTLARLAGITLPHVDGRVLTEALSPAQLSGAPLPAAVRATGRR